MLPRHDPSDMPLGHFLRETMLTESALNRTAKQKAVSQPVDKGQTENYSIAVFKQYRGDSLVAALAGATSSRDPPDIEAILAVITKTNNGARN